MKQVQMKQVPSPNETSPSPNETSPSPQQMRKSESKSTIILASPSSSPSPCSFVSIFKSTVGC